MDSISRLFLVATGSLFVSGSMLMADTLGDCDATLADTQCAALKSEAFRHDLPIALLVYAIFVALVWRWPRILRWPRS